MAEPKRPKSGPSATAAPSLPIRAGRMSPRRSSGTRPYGSLDEESNRAKILAAIFTLALLLGVIIWLFASEQQLPGDTSVTSKEAAGFTSPPVNDKSSAPTDMATPPPTEDNTSTTAQTPVTAKEQPPITAVKPSADKPGTPSVPAAGTATPATPPAAKGGTSAPGTGAGTTPGKYTIQPGDTPAAIAAKVWGDSSKVNLLLKANPGMDPKRLKVGQEIKLPKAP